VRKRRSSRVVALLQAALGGIRDGWLEMVTVLVVTLTAAGIATLVTPTVEGWRSADPSAARWPLPVAVTLGLGAVLTVLVTTRGVGISLVQAQRSRLDLLAALGLTPRQCAIVIGLQPIAAGTAGTVLGTIGAALATSEVGPASSPTALGGAVLCLAATGIGAGMAGRGVLPSDSDSQPARRSRQGSPLHAWGLPATLALGAAIRRSPSLRGLRRLLPVLIGLDALARDLATGEGSTPFLWHQWQRLALPPGRLGLAADLLLALVVGGYLCTFLVSARRQRAELETTIALGATRSQLLVALLLSAIRSSLAGLVLATLAVGALHRPLLSLTSAPTHDAAAVLFSLLPPSVLVPSAAALLAGMAGASLAVWGLVPALGARRSSAA
jgi:hypothetical protein